MKANTKQLLLILLILFDYCASAQTKYVAVSSLNMRDQPTTSSNIITRLSYCDNLESLGASEIEGWIKIRYKGREGFVSNQYVKTGKCIKSTTSYRVGAICKDGWRSSATGRGACSHHGGVDYWLYEEDVNYRIVPN